MTTLVVYDSQYGNTERIAQTIADASHTFGPARAIHAAATHPAELHGVDLLILGSPTQAWRATSAMQSFLDSIPAEQFHGMAVACFDTRFQKSHMLTGSAANGMGKYLRKRGVTLLTEPESFFVTSKEGPLYDGELERAAAWARILLNKVEVPHPVGQL